MIEKTMHSVSNDETRYHINGVYFEQFKNPLGLFYKMVSTDSHRLSVITRLAKKSANGDISSHRSEKQVGLSDKHLDQESFYSDEDPSVNSVDQKKYTISELNNDIKKEIEEGQKEEEVEEDQKGIIIPKKGLNEIRRILERGSDHIEMSYKGGQLTMKQGDTFLLIRLIDGIFPKYEHFIPEVVSKQVNVSRDKLISSLKLASILTSEKSRSVNFFLKNRKIEITSQNPDLGDVKEEVDIDYNGDEMQIGFNVKYLLDVLNSIDEDRVDIGFTHCEAGGVFHPSNDHDYTCVVMPMKL